MALINFKFTKSAKLLLLITLAAAILRFYHISSNPPGLYWDEAAYGYDAYSILKTGHDQHGHFMPLFFESFGDWKLPVYHYLLVPSIAVFGLNEFAVRFPSAFFGTLTIPLFYLFIRKLLSKEFTSEVSKVTSERTSEVFKKMSNVNGQVSSVPLLSAFFLAISPWHIQFSRAGFETTPGLFFVISGVYLFLKGIQSNSAHLRGAPRSVIAHLGGVLGSPFTLSFILLTLSMYTYHAYRIFTPLLAIALVIIFGDEIKKNISKIILPLVASAVLFIPLLIFTFSPQGTLRAQSQSAFKLEDFKKDDLDYNQKSKKPLRFMSKYWYQTPVYDSYISLNQYFDHFSPVFLFLRGDQIGRHSQVDMGQLYIFEAPLIVAAFFALKVLSKKTLWILGAWILLAPMPAVIVSVTPHANRTMQMAPIFAFISALGAYFLLTKIKPKVLLMFPIAIAAFYFLSYLHMLFVHYPIKFSPDWQDGNAKMVQLVEEFQGGFENVYITNGSEAYIYLLFYQKYDPQKFIAENSTKDAFSKYRFVSSDFNIYDKGRLLYVSPSWQKVDGINLANVYDSGGRLVYGIWEVGGQD